MEYFEPPALFIFFSGDEHINKATEEFANFLANMRDAILNDAAGPYLNSIEELTNARDGPYGKYSFSLKTIHLQDN